MTAPQTPARRALTFAASLGALVLLWSALALLRADPEVLPGPAEVARILWDETVNGPLLHHLWATLRRVALAFFLSMCFGAMLGYALGVLPRLNALAGP